MTTPASHPPDDVRTGLRPPQFGLRAVWLGLTCLCVMLAAMKWLPPMVSAVLAVLGLSVVAHVLGNALGMQLRGSGNQRLSEQPPPEGTPHRAAGVVAAEHYAPQSQLTQRRSLGRLVYVFPVVGATILASSGFFLLTQALGRKATVANLSFGVGAFAVIGAILGFLIGSFVKVMIMANLEAWRNGEPQHGAQQNGEPPP